MPGLFPSRDSAFRHPFPSPWFTALFTHSFAFTEPGGGGTTGKLVNPLPKDFREPVSQARRSPEGRASCLDGVVCPCRNFQSVGQPLAGRSCCSRGRLALPRPPLWPPWQPGKCPRRRGAARAQPCVPHGKVGDAPGLLSRTQESEIPVFADVRAGLGVFEEGSGKGMTVVSTRSMQHVGSARMSTPAKDLNDCPAILDIGPQHWQNSGFIQNAVLFFVCFNRRYQEYIIIIIVIINPGELCSSVNINEVYLSLNRFQMT